MEISLFLKLTVLSVIISFVLIQILDNKENLYLNATNPGSKKLMVVDQTTGAISFLNESGQGIDQAFAGSDSAQSTLLKSLFGPELDGEGGEFKTKLDAAILAATKPIADDVDAFKGTDSMTTLREYLDTKISAGDSIAIATNHREGQSDGTFYLADHDCDGTSGARNWSGTMWCKGSHEAYNQGTYRGDVKELTLGTHAHRMQLIRSNNGRRIASGFA